MCDVISAARASFLCLAVLMFGATSSCAETIRVQIDKLVFSPASVTAKVGDTIEWVNRDALAHTATVEGDWDVMIPAKEIGKLVLTKTGSVEYYCRFHPNMTARLEVLPQ
jgi:plastocyanin